MTLPARRPPVGAGVFGRRLPRPGMGWFTPRPPFRLPAGLPNIFVSDRASWERARRAFLADFPATADVWGPLVSSPACTPLSPPPALLRARLLLGADALAWAPWSPDQPLAWLCVLLLPTLLLHHLARGEAASAPPVTHAARVAAIFSGDFAAALADRDAGVSSSPPRCGRLPPRSQDVGSYAPGVPARVTVGQRRALRLVRAGRLSAAARALTAAPVAPRSPAVWEKALSLFPPAGPRIATRASVEAAFPVELSSAADFGRISGVPGVLPREAATDAIRRAPRGSALGPSGLRIEHLRALGDEGQASLAGVLRLLAGEAAARIIPPLTAHALAGADFLLLCKSGGLDVDGLSRLRPIEMPEVLRIVAASDLAGTVRASAARLLAPLQMGVGVSNPCERVVHELTAELAHRPHAALLQPEYRNAFNLVSRAAAVPYFTRAFPLLRHYLSSVYLGRAPAPPRVYGWADGAATSHRRRPVCTSLAGGRAGRPERRPARPAYPRGGNASRSAAPRCCPPHGGRTRRPRPCRRRRRDLGLAGGAPDRVCGGRRGGRRAGAFQVRRVVPH